MAVYGLTFDTVASRKNIHNHFPYFDNHLYMHKQNVLILKLNLFTVLTL